ncbi:MAG: hypothetical protein MR871_10615 [Lachnospiraceae bacterium]|nr:hypothetical protein [Lachnospiraceae bacterium]MDD7076806.1 hypothetical protein [Lachnospiraceae bacterium]MDY3729821.1 hypothetical protein [Candidatus Choladocola sp.]
MKEKLKTCFLANWTLSEKCLFTVDVLLLGVLIGWITSPLKNGFGIFSNNTWDIKTNCEQKEEEME